MDYSETIGLFPPRKKIRSEVNLSEFFSPEELAGILSTCSYKQDLKIFNQELDLLDDICTDCISEKTENVRLAHRSPDIYSIFIPHFKQEVVPPEAQDFEEPRSKDKLISSYPEIALDAKREASVLQQVSKLHRKGLWSSDRLPKVMEPKCEILHYTHLLNEAIWLSIDFREELKWKKHMASKLARSAQVYLITRHEWNQQLQRFEEHLRMRNAARVAKMVKDWWGSIGQDSDLVSIQTSRERWDYAYKKNQDCISFFSDMGPSWLAAVKFDLEDKKLHESPDVSHDGRILSYIDGDGDSDDKDWRPDIEGEYFTGLDSCSQSTGSSLAASFVDDNDMSSFGVAVCSPSEHVPLGYNLEHISPLCTKACNQRSKHSGLNKRRKSQSEQSYISECGDQDDPSEESHSIILETRLSSNSPESCNQSVESSEVQGLISDMEVPLDRLLEPYFDQRWYIKNRVTSRPRFYSSGSDISNCEVERRSLNGVPQHIQNEISILQNEASMPLHEILPSGYMDYLSSVNTQKSLATRSLQLPSQSNFQMSGSSGFSSKTDGVDASLSITNNTLSFDSGDEDFVQIDSVSSRSSGASISLDHDHSEGGNLLPPKIRFRTNSRMVFAPWYSPIPSVSSHLGDLHTAALELLPLKLTSMAGADSSHLISEVHTLAYSPTLRIPYFPTPNLGAAVSWIRHAFVRSVPALLLTNSHLSGDAELAVAAHLGQLAVANPRHHLPSESLPSEFCSNQITGEWGPHLIITPRLCLPAWRKRLQMWCPGLRVLCLGLTRKSERSGTGHFLRESVARGAVNICLVSYTALRLKPSRFSRIQWSSVIFDQIQHIILQSYKYTDLVHIDSTSCQQAIQKVNSQNCAENPPVHCETDRFRENVTENVNVKQIVDDWPRDSSKTLNRRKSEWFDLILNRFGRNGHRLLICSSSDLIYHKHSPYLLDLSKLLLLKDLPNDENYDSWLNDFFQAVCQSSSHRHCSPNSCLLTKPSKKQLLKFLDPFVIRFDDEDDWDSFINDEVIECHMSSIQQKLHDSILSTKAAENALKTGNLLDLLQTVSVASRACSHPALAGTHPSSSKIFRHTLHNLKTRSSVLHGPYVFKSFQKIRDSSNICYSNGGGLLFNTPESVLRVVKLLRHSELSDTTCQMFNLFEALKPSTYIRNRIATLTLQFNQLLTSNNHAGLYSNRNVPVFNILSNSVNSSVSRLPNGNLESNYNRYGNQLTNGILLPQHCSSENYVDPDIEIVSIPQRQKRPRESVADRNSIFYKRRRVEEYDTHRPFLDYMDMESSSGCRENSSNWSSSRLPLSNSDPYMAHSDQFRSATNTVTHNFYSSNEHLNNTNLNENTFPWLKDNTRKCTQLNGFSDWCSQDTCNLLRLDAFSDDYIANSKNTPPDLWNVVMDQFTQWTDTSILCTRSRVVATPLRLVSRIGPIDPGLLENKKTFSLSDIFCSHSFSSFCMGSRILLHLNHIFYPLTERARLLAPTSCSNVGFHSPLLSCISNSKSPISQLFKDSGKFYHLHQKLTDLLGVKSINVKRPRCIYFIAHHTAFLDLLNAYLSTSWRLFHRVRIPSNYKTVNANTCSLIDRINNWPHGTVGPLLVLIHARSPATSLVSLRADSNVHIIICDADWRAEVTDNLKAIIHSWVLNGLSTSCESTCHNNSSYHKVNTYRLLSTGDFGYPANRLSVEACLLRGVACRLLPRAVFHAHSTTHVSRRSLLFARVQPNVVNGLLSGVHARKLTHRSLIQKIKSNEFERLDLFNDRNFFGPINKQDTLSHSSASSIASSFSCMGTENRLDEFSNEKVVGEEEDVLLFQEREPLSELLLHQALELFEDPVDTQAWCCANAEKVAIVNEFISEDDCNDDEMGDFYFVDDNLFDLGDDGNCNWELSNELETSSNFLQSSEYNDSVKSYQYRLMKQLGYTDLIGWEVATYELLNRISVLESQLSESNNDWLSYHYPMNDNLMIEQNEQQLQHIQSPSEIISSFSHFSQLPIWCPFESHQKYLHSFSDISEPISFLKDEPNLLLSVEDSNDWISSSFEYDLGYEAVPMTESELPPLIIPSVIQNNDNNTVVDRKSARRRPCINHSSLSSRPLNNDVSSYRNATSRLNSKNLKRRALSSSAHSVSHHINSSCSNNILDGSATTYTATGPNFAPIENETRSQDSRIIGSLPHSRDPSSNGTSIPSSIASGNNNTVPLSSVSSSSNVYSNNAIVLSLHSYGCNASGNLTTLKLHIPRVSYNKAVTNARIHRLRRINANIGPGSDTAAVALAAGAHLLQQQQHFSTSNVFPEHNQHLTNAAVVAAAAAFSPWNSVTTNPTILARYGGHTSFCHSGSVNSLSTRHLPSSLQNYMHTTNTAQYSSLKYPVSGSSSLPVNNNSSSNNTIASTQIASQLYVGKPLEWLIYEEAALYLCITKLQELNFEINSSSSNLPTPSTPNYRFAEFFLNNYLLNRSYRGARQCLLAHFKMQNVFSSANTVAASSTSSTGVVGGGYPVNNNPFAFNPDDIISHSASLNMSSGLQQHHGPSSRKVKNKMKSAAVAAAAAAAASSSSVLSGISSGGGSSQFFNTGNGGSSSIFGTANSPNSGASSTTSAASATAALNRCRGYLFYQHLQTWLNLTTPNTNNTSHTNMTTDSSSNISTHLSPILHAIKFAEDSQASVLRKAIRDTLSTPSVQIPSIYRPSGSRRTCVVGSSGVGGGSTSSALGYHSNTHATISGSSTSSSHYAHHSSSGSGQLSHGLLTGHSATVSNTTTPALLTHHRHRHHHVTYDHGQSHTSNVPTTTDSTMVVGSLGNLNSATGSSGSVVHSGPIIQKNPTHIAALQEHNINPDTLITPAMVIKNKEEREARQRAETLSTSNQVNSTSTTSITSHISSSSITSTSSIFQGDSLSSSSSDVSNTQHSENICLHSNISHTSSSSEHVYKTSTHYPSSSLSNNSTSGDSTTLYNLHGCSSTSSLPTTSFPSGRTNAQLSFAHNLSHRGSSVMLPIRSGFNTNTVTPSGSILSFTGQQQHHRLLGAQNTSSPTGHYQFQPRQTLLHSSIGRLTHLTPGSPISNTSQLTGTHHVISSGAATASSSTDDGCGNTRSVDLTSGSILIPGNWRTATNPRSLNVQTIVSSTPTVLRRSATFTGVGLSNQSTSGLQTCRLNPATSNISQSLSSNTTFTGTYMNTQVAKIPYSSSSTGQPNFYIHQRPQFLSSTHTTGSSSPRNVFTPPSNIAVVPSASNNYSSSVTHLPQILRPRSALRGSVVQPTFVRTISPVGSGTGGSIIPVPGTQHGARLSPNVGGSSSSGGGGVSPSTSMFLGRVTTLTVSSNNPSVSSILNSRTGTQHSISPTVFQSLRTCISGGITNLSGNEQSYLTSQNNNNNSGGNSKS
ncbi:Helicase domino [Schistosoma japonicum]|nr:Helicase domino [Schistosoma japonicum]